MNIAKFLRTSVFYRAPFVATAFFIEEAFISEPGYSVYLYYTALLNKDRTKVLHIANLYKFLVRT